MPLLNSLRFLRESLALVFQLNDPINICLDIAILAIGLYGFLIVANELCIQHKKDPSKTFKWLI